ncbi:AGC/NDR protein kinase [Myxozyma melibiosi]|uniref:non-specific serine/threonine protein kinase n=1 Tax=Myxozyma melibiosi TaxID=54550 RepID=A0ABR1EZK0_9ASCO
MSSPFTPTHNLYSSGRSPSPKRSPERAEPSTVENIAKSFNGLYMSNAGSSTADKSFGSKLATVDENHDDITSVIRLDENRDPHGAAAGQEARSGYECGSLSLGRSARGTTGLSAEDMKKLNDPTTKRLVNAAQLYFLDYYFDLLTYIHNRKLRLQRFKQAAEYLSPSEQQTQWRSYTGRERAYLRKRRTRLRYGDFDIITQVGQGGYGHVYLARKADTKEICALKVMKKSLLFKLDETRHVLTERDILTAANTPWLVKLLYAFQDKEKIYLAMEYVPGGDYRTLLNNTGVLSPRHARFYISEMFCAVESLHKLGYIHRDLKPENFLIDASGHIKLTDFGLSAGSLSRERVESMRVKLDAVKSTRVTHRTISERQNLYRSLRETDLNYANSIVGSPDYMALEVLEGKQYDFTIDYWSLGCMLFETLCGYPPFAGANMNETYSNLRCWKDVFRRPIYDNNQYAFSDRTWDLLTKLINDQTNRLHSFQEVQNHAYFSEIDWTHIRRLQPPFIPQLDSDVDAGYFDDFSNQEDMAKYKEVHDKQAQLEMLAERPEKVNRTAFIGFTFKHSKALSILDDGQLNEGARGARGGAQGMDFQTMF